MKMVAYCSSTNARARKIRKIGIGKDNQTARVRRKASNEKKKEKKKRKEKSKCKERNQLNSC